MAYVNNDYQLDRMGMVLMQNDLVEIAVVSIFDGTGKSFIARNLAFAMKWSYTTAIEGKVLNWGSREYKTKKQPNQQLVECSSKTLIKYLEKDQRFGFVLLIMDSNRCLGCDAKRMVALVEKLRQSGIAHGALINNHRPGRDRQILSTLETMNVPLIGRIPVMEETQVSLRASGEYVSDERTLCILKAIGRILSAHIKRLNSDCV